MPKIPVGILGATGFVGQYLVALLENHPFFTLTHVYASSRSVNKSYGEAIDWRCPNPLSQSASALKVLSLDKITGPELLFSALDQDSAYRLERQLLQKGHLIITNASSNRMDPDVPLVIPEINGDMMQQARLIANPNCTTAGLCLALKPIRDLCGLQQVTVVSLQAISGAGLSTTMDIEENVLPYIYGEEEKMETEPKKILSLPSLPISAHCNRVAVPHGHLICVSVKTEQTVNEEQLINAWNSFKGLSLPSAPEYATYYREDPIFPQPKHHLTHPMSCAIGRLRTCSTHDYKFVALTHNMVRGAAGGSLLLAEQRLGR